MQQFTADDPETKSADAVADNVDALKGLFPDAFTEGKVDFAVLKQLLGGAVDEGDEKYGLNWHGKRAARQLALTPSTGTLRPCPDESVDWDATQNLMIEGDNLEVLKLLQKSYGGKVKLIYIDPPYNTGKDFVYPDNFRDGIANYFEQTGQVDDDGKKVSTNAESSGRFHSAWLDLMYPRLRVARGLLREDGVCVISIDDNEFDNLVKIGSEVFGEENFLGNIVVQLNPRGRHLDRYLAKTHEYLCIFAKDLSAAGEVLCSIAKDDRMTSEYRKTDSRGAYRELELRNRNPSFNRKTRPNLYYPIYVDSTSGSVSVTATPEFDVEVFPRNSEGVDSCWTWSRDKLAAESQIVLGREVAGGGWRIFRRDYLLDEDGNAARTLPKALWTDKEFNNDLGKKAVQGLFGSTIFDFPKSPDLIRKIVEIGSGPDGIVMDFFAGSGTTGEAVMMQNIADGGDRRYVLVQLPERLSASAPKQGSAAAVCLELGLPLNIASLTAERLRRAAEGMRQVNPSAKADFGVRVLKLDSSNIEAWEPDREDLGGSLTDAIEHLKTNRSEQDVLFELLLKLGLELTVPIETRSISGKTVYSVGAGTLLVCLAESVDQDDIEAIGLGIAAWHEELHSAGESTVVFRDSAFADDVAKTNLTAILEQHGLSTVRSL